MTIEGSNQSSDKPLKQEQGSERQGKVNSKQSKKETGKSQKMDKSDGREVLLKAGSLEYKMPGKRTRIFLGSLVVGLNLILLLAVGLYFYSPAFQTFVYNIGR